MSSCNAFLWFILPESITHYFCAHVSMCVSVWIRRVTPVHAFASCRHVPHPASFSLPRFGHPASAWAHQREWYQEAADTLQRSLRGGSSQHRSKLLHLPLLWQVPDTDTNLQSARCRFICFVWPCFVSKIPCYLKLTRISTHLSSDHQLMGQQSQTNRCVR